MYTLFVILHIMSATALVGLGLTTLVLNGFRKKLEGTIGETYVMRAMLACSRTMGNVGAIGLLITGAGIAGIGGLQWFAFGTLPWLAVKQVIYLLILGMTFGLFVPRSRPVSKQLLDGSPATPEIRKAINQIVTIQYAIQILALVNVVLGEWKPMLWAAAK